MSKTSYEESHNDYLNHQVLEGIIYPSCRSNHPLNHNFAVMDIKSIDTGIHNIDNLEFSLVIKNIIGELAVKIKLQWPLKWK